MMDVELVKDEVFSKLQLLDHSQLGQCGVQLNLSIPPNKMGKKTAMRTFILRYLTSEDVEDDDQVDDIFRRLKESIEKMLADKGKTEAVDKDISVRTEVEDSSNSVKDEVTHGNATTTRVELARFKEFKVTAGTFGGDENSS